MKAQFESAAVSVAVETVIAALAIDSAVEIDLIMPVAVAASDAAVVVVGFVGYSEAMETFASGQVHGLVDEATAAAAAAAAVVVEDEVTSAAVFVAGRPWPTEATDAAPAAAAVAAAAGANVASVVAEVAEVVGVAFAAALEDALEGQQMIPLSLIHWAALPAVPSQQRFWALSDCCLT